MHMTLDTLLSLQLPYNELKQLWLVFDVSLKERLESVQTYGYHQVSPIKLNDGNYAICADVLTEIEGIYAQTFLALDQTTFSSVQVVNITDIVFEKQNNQE